MKAIEMGKKCDSCANINCGLKAKAGKNGQGVEMRAKMHDVVCQGFKAYQQKGFSLLEMASEKSISEIAELLHRADLVFQPDNSARGFHLA